MTTEVLGNEKIKNNEIMVVKHSSELAHSPSYPFFLRRMADLMEDGHSLKMTTWVDSESGIIWGEIDSEIVGIFAYKKDQVKHKTLNILLTAVHPDHRNKGIHTTLNRYFEKVALDLGCNFVVATVHPNNKTRLMTCEKDGLKIFYHKLGKKIQLNEN
jgi:GNAT superfamily N-acetyltransferase